MNRFWVAPLIAAFASVTFAQGAMAQTAAPAAQPIVLTSDPVKVDKIVVENGKEKHVLAEADVVVPGDHLVFSTQYRNAGAQPVTNFVITNPIPAAVTVAPESAATLNVSVDGGKTWGRLATLTVSDGKGGKRAAQAGDVTHLRWTLPLVAPGASGKVGYNAIVR